MGPFVQRPRPRRARACAYMQPTPFAVGPPPGAPAGRRPPPRTNPTHSYLATRWAPPPNPNSPPSLIIHGPITPPAHSTYLTAEPPAKQNRPPGVTTSTCGMTASSPCGDCPASAAPASCLSPISGATRRGAYARVSSLGSSVLTFIDVCRCIRICVWVCLHSYACRSWVSIESVYV
jgi:hypothetical protein